MVLRWQEKSKKHRQQTPTLEAGMYGFQRRGEELLGVKNYLYGHGKYQLVPVSNWWGMATRGASGHIALFFNHCRWLHGMSH